MPKSPRRFNFAVPTVTAKRFPISRSCVALAFLVLPICGLAIAAMAQVSPTGIDPFGTYQRNNIQTINVFNLNNHIEIPIFTKTARDLTFTGRFIWDTSDGSVGIPCTNQGNPATCWITTPLLAVQTGTANYNSHVVAGSQTCQPADANQATIFQFDSITDEINTVHSIQPGQGQIEVGPGCSAGTATFSTNDNWLLKVTYTNQNCFSSGCFTSVTETDPQGNVHNSGNAIITNPNGNSLVSTSSGTTDSTGNVVWSSPSSGVNSYPVQGGGTVNVQTSSSTLTIQNSPCFLPNEQIALPTGISLPDGSQYTFVYESSTGNYPSSTVTGRIHSITVSAGGTYTYTYSGGTFATSNTCTPLSLTITGPDGSNWSYSRTVCTSNCGSGPYTTTVVTDPACNDTIYNFDADGRQMQAVKYQGTAGTAYCSSSTKTKLETVVTCYDGSFTSCGTQVSAGPCSNNQLVCRQDIYTYLPGLTQPSLSEIFYNSANLPTQDNEFDYGVNTGVAPTATPIRATITTYASIGSNILNRPSCVQVTAGASPSTCGTVTSTTNSITLFQNYDAHGNVGTIKQWVSGSSYLQRSFNYTSTGLLQTTTDVNNAQTTNTWNDCNGSYISSIAEPLGLSRTLSWDCLGGVLVSATDESGETTQYKNGDPFWRLTEITDPLGNTTTNSYSPTTAESVLAFVNPSCSTCAVDKLTTFDGMGRPYLSQTRQAPGSSNFDTVVTGYDANSRVASVGLPCLAQESQPCTSPVTTTTYDALSRPLKIQDGGGGFKQYNYAPRGSFNNDVLVQIGPAPTGENLKQRQMQYNALGRLTSVCEITSASGSGSCAQNTAQTGYWTKYAYDALGNLTSVSQNAQGSPVQPRTYTYDGLSRLTSESNPESGTKNYVFDMVAQPCNGDTHAYTFFGDLVQATNVGSGRCAVYLYDALHRLTDVGNNQQSATNPCKRFRYDNNGGYPGSTKPSALVNTTGRLIEAATDTCIASNNDALLTDEWLSYDNDGRQTDLFESTPNSGGYYHIAVDYWADGIVHTLSGLLASGGRFIPTETYTPDGEGRWASVSASFSPNPVTSTSYNPAGQITAITYGSTDSDSFGYDNAGRMNNYTYTVNGASEVGVPTWNPNGTLGSLKITDPFNSSDAQTCTYGYDDLARITSANCGSAWSQTFSYDSFGNLTKVPGSSVSWSPGYDPNTNHYTMTGTGYDADGNVTNDSFRTIGWNVYGDPVAFGAKTLTYDAFDRMVDKLDAGVANEFVYHPASGSLLARMNSQSVVSVRVPLPGSWALYAATNVFHHYEHLDWLGNTRLSSFQNRTVSSDVAYAPFGEPYATTATSGVSFTGMRGDVAGATGDTTNGVYDFLAREYPYTEGRWLSPDPAGLSAADPEDPQSWNLYAYVSNNPLNATDPDGTVKCPDGTEADVCVVSTFPDDDITGSLDVSFVQIRQTVLQSLQNAADAFLQWITAPRDPGCVTAFTAGGAIGGAAIGANIGFGGGVVAGGVGGTFALPGGGTLGGAAFGGPAGAAAGSVAGGFLGGAGGRVAGFFACATGGGGSGGGGGSAGDGRPEGVPNSWKKVTSRNGTAKWVDPSNPHNFVRLRTDGTITQVRNGMALDVNGNPVLQNSPAAHFPASQFVFRP